MQIPELEFFRRETEALAALVSAPADYLPTYVISRDFAYPHIEYDARGYHWVVIERGQENQRITSPDIQETLYVTFQSITFNMAVGQELKNRIEGKDCRRLIWKFQIDFLNRLKPEWAQRRQKEIDAIMANHPFDDLSSLRAQLTGRLRVEGYQNEIAWKMACEQFPLPEHKKKVEPCG